MKHVNIPVFIPHLGCPNACVFCNQRTISGTEKFDEGDVVGIIDSVLETTVGCEREIAFFGGSFTGIDRDLMIRLLDTAEGYVSRGEVSGIRLSTRPDYIDRETVGILKKYTVSQVELGIQSMSDRVLELSKRGHTSDDTRRAVALLKENGFSVVGQMMIGLPGSTLGDEVYTATEICAMGCDGARIYPTVVFKDTELDAMRLSGEYAPLDVGDAVERSADALEVFEMHGVECIRIGLCDSENLHSEKTYSAGPAHPALGEKVMSRLFYKKIAEAVHDNTGAGAITVECPKGAVSKVMGNKGENRRRLEKEFGIKSVKTIENDDLLGYNIKVLFS